MRDCRKILTKGQKSDQPQRVTRVATHRPEGWEGDDTQTTGWWEEAVASL